MTRRVWILGAGFSRSLGAPLLNDLLSFRMRSRLIHGGLLKDLSVLMMHDPKQADLHTQLFPQEMVYSLFHYGTNYPEGFAFFVHQDQPVGEKIWAHAEEFLECLDDSATRDNNHELNEIRNRAFRACSQRLGGDRPATRLCAPQISSNSEHGLTAQQLAIEAKRIIAAEVCVFLRRVSAERLQPYKTWLHRLTGDDTIITFNYDCLLESIATEDVRQIRVHGVEVPTISYRNGEPPVLLKLHGSVDWKAREDWKPEHGGVPFERSGDLEYATKHPEDGQICTPGASKLTATQTHLAPLWRLAAERIREAEEVYFIGYRIPESDATAREMILNALADSGLGDDIRIVLGPPSFDRDRLKLLLGMAGCSGFPQDATAEDFLQGWSIEERRRMRDSAPRQPPSQPIAPTHPSTELNDRLSPQTTFGDIATTPQAPIPLEPDEHGADPSRQ